MRPFWYGCLSSAPIIISHCSKYSPNEWLLRLARPWSYKHWVEISLAVLVLLSSHWSIFFFIYSSQIWIQGSCHCFPFEILVHVLIQNSYISKTLVLKLCFKFIHVLSGITKSDMYYNMYLLSVNLLGSVLRITDKVLISDKSDFATSPSVSKKSNWRQLSSFMVNSGDCNFRDTFPCSMFLVRRKYLPKIWNRIRHLLLMRFVWQTPVIQ